MSMKTQPPAVAKATGNTPEAAVEAVPAAQPAAPAKAAKKLVPRTAPKPAAKTVAQPAAPAKAARKASAVDEAVERHRQVLAEALVEAQAIKYDAPAVVAAAGKPRKAGKPAKAEKPARAGGDNGGKAKKPKLVRDSYAMPEAEYARIGELKKRLAGLGVDIKKSELLRAGLLLLAGLADGELMAVAGRVERIKTGRPAKK